MYYLYLDESGDLGDLIQSPGTSQHFVITILEVSSETARKTIEKAVVRTLRNKLHGKRHRKHDQMTELKAAKTVFAIKEYFYRQIAATPLNLYAVILDKARFVNDSQMSKKRVYQFITHLVILLKRDFEISTKSGCKFIRLCWSQTPLDFFRHKTTKMDNER
jgi:hypothetical protein